ncbi:MAG: aldo/keto reductase [Gemmatimonadetes bacterium]|nr:aldo/keto reductase [Gemmatimonadota bacterium]MDA1102346.1 aldo/keto reductase [Gemmatimonadota bacterium]
MERIELAPGFEISRVLTGLWQIADLEREGDEVDADRAADEIQRYVDAGLTTFDMADHYGSSELIAGCYSRRGGAPAELMTKWVPKPGRHTPEDVREAVERALERMGLATLDVLQFHAWSYADPAWLDCMFSLQDLKAEGLIRHLAMTNTDAAHMRMLLDSGVEVVSNQVCYSLIDQRAAGAMTDLCREKGVKILAFGTLAGGFLTERWVATPEPAMEELETWSQMKYKRFIDAAGGWARFQTVLASVERAAKRLGVSMANIASRYILEAPGVGGVIIGARLGHSDHIDDTRRLFEFELDAESRADIGEALARLDPIPGDCGDEYRKPPFLTAAGDLSDHFDAMPSPYPTESGQNGRTKALSGTVWEDLAGFSRAVRKGNRIFVSGTTATHRDRLVGGTSAASQAHFCLDKIEGAIQSLGGTIDDVVRTRIYVATPDVAEDVSRAHGARLGHVQPANTLVHAGLIGDGYLVEMEAEAVVD